MYYIVAGFTTTLLVLILICNELVFKAEPPLPPSTAQAEQRANEETDFRGSIKRLLTNPRYLLLVLSYGINVGVFYAISTLLNQVVLLYFPKGEEDAGRIGLLMVLSGMVGSVLSGIYERITFLVCSFFMTGYLPVGFEFAAELTYPEPEGTSAGLLNAAVQVFGIMLTNAYSWLLENTTDMWANGALCAALVVGIIITAFIKSDLRRQAAQGPKLPMLSVQ
ncbi:Feline leukemia virus subgroup C receptor-related protein 2 [Blattella germanica]|nr:Feline leukemia virus subgroup C receptor-related protein 2 [Blattella germanica]